MEKLMKVLDVVFVVLGILVVVALLPNFIGIQDSRYQSHHMAPNIIVTTDTRTGELRVCRFNLTAPPHKKYLNCSEFLLGEEKE